MSFISQVVANTESAGEGRARWHRGWKRFVRKHSRFRQSYDSER